MTRFNQLSTASLLIALTAASANAATVSYTVADFDNVSQVSTAGTFVQAMNLGGASDGDDVAANAGATLAVTMNGVTFAGDAGTGTADFFVDSVQDWRRPNYQNPGGADGIVTGLTVAQGEELFQSYERGGGGPLGQLTGLTIGQAYEVQFFLDRNSANSTLAFGYAENVGDAGTFPAAVQVVSPLHPIVVTGTFTATETTQQFFISEDGNGPTGGTNFNGIGELNAYQLREAVPEPGSLALLGLGGLALLRRRRPITC